MPKTNAQLRREAEQVQARIAAAHKALDEIRALARKHLIAADDVFPRGGWPGDQAPAEATTSGTPENVFELARPPYTDGHGNVWNGKGRRPNWLVKALADGLSLRDLMLR